MKRFAYTLFCMAAFATSALAQANSDTLRVVESNVSRVGEDVIVDMKLDLSHIEVGRNRTLVCAISSISVWNARRIFRMR